MKVSDLAAGLVFAVFGLALLAYGASLPPMPGQRYGAGLFPILLGLCALGGGAALAWSGARRRAREPFVAAAPWARDRRLVGNFALALGLILLYVLASERIGFIPLSIAMLLALFLRLGVPFARGAVIAVVATAVIQVVFARGLRVPLPRGLLEGLIW
jgi:putative tricarboxylic transport membrane protein